MGPLKVEATTKLFIVWRLLVTCVRVDALMIQAVVLRASIMKGRVLRPICDLESRYFFSIYRCFESFDRHS